MMCKDQTPLEISRYFWDTARLRIADSRADVPALRLCVSELSSPRSDRLSIEHVVPELSITNGITA
jgi:hypothetical protein